MKNERLFKESIDFLNSLGFCEGIKSFGIDKLSQSVALGYPKAYIGTPRGEVC